MSRISDISHPIIVETALSGEVPTNSSLACPSGQTSDCGTLMPEIAGVIFDANRFRIDLFIAEEYLETLTFYDSKFLPESSSSFGLMQGISANTSGVALSNNDQQNYSVFGNTLFGWQENHLSSNWDYSRDGNFSIDTLYLERDSNGLQMGAGYLGYGGMMTSEFSGTRQIVGMKIGSSLNSRIDIADTSSTPIRIFTNGRRRVEVLRDDRLIYSTMVEAGSQEIDTRTFPQGAYNVTVRTYDGSVLDQEFSRFFTKSVRLAPSDEILWYLEGGEMTRRENEKVLPDGLSEWLMRGGLQFRLAENSGMTLRGTSTGQEQSLESELFYQGNDWDLSVTGMYGSSNAKGAALETSAAIGPFFLSYFHRRLWNPGHQKNQNSSQNVELLGGSFENQSLSMSTGALTGSLSLSLSRNNSIERGRETIYGARWFRNILRFSGHDIDIQLDYSQSDDDKIATAGLTMRRSSTEWNYNIRGQGRWEKRNETPTDKNFGYSADSRWFADDILNGSGELGLRYDDITGDDRLLGGELVYEQARFRSDLNADYINQRQGESFINYNARIDTSFAMNTDNAGIGGGRTSDSAVIVNIDGSPHTTFDVLINGSSSGIARGGRRTVIPLTPFASYEVSIRPRGLEFYNYDQGIRNVTLYPGNVESLLFTSHEELVILGKLVDANGENLESVSISTEHSNSWTDDFGIFQLRIPVTQTVFEARLSEEETCQADIPGNYENRAGIGLVGVLKCL